MTGVQTCALPISFSALSVETVLLIDADHATLAIGYLLGSVLGGLALCAGVARLVLGTRGPVDRSVPDGGEEDPC